MIFDLVLLSLAAAIFLVSAGLVAACGRLAGETS